MTPYPTELFRPEVVHKRRERLEGDLLLRHPLGPRLVVFLLAGVMVALGLWVSLGSYTRSELAPGTLVTDVPTTKIVATRAGRISELYISDGDNVIAGQKLATVVVEQPIETGGSVAAETVGALDVQRSIARNVAWLARSRAEIERARLVSTLVGLRRQGSKITNQLTLQQELIKSEKETFDRVLPLGDQGFVSRIEVESRRQKWIQAQQQLEQLQQQSEVLESQSAQASAQLARVAIDGATEVANANSAAAGYGGQRAQAIAQRGYVITAPGNGRVTAMQVAVGKTVDGSAPLMEIVPEGMRLHAELYAPSRAIGFVQPGHEVRILFDAFPYQKFGSYGGRIVRISKNAFDPREIAGSVKVDEPVYRIDVALDKQSISAFSGHSPLQPGMTLSANLILDRRSFADWLLDPLKAVSRKNE